MSTNSLCESVALTPHLCIADERNTGRVPLPRVSASPLQPSKNCDELQLKTICHCALDLHNPSSLDDAGAEHPRDHPHVCLMCAAPPSDLKSLRRSDISLSSFHTTRSTDIASSHTPRRRSSATTVSTSSPMPRFSTSTMSVSRDSHSSSNGDDRSPTATVTSTVSVSTTLSSPSSTHRSPSVHTTSTRNTTQANNVALSPSIPHVVQSTMSKQPPTLSPRAASRLVSSTSQPKSPASPVRSRSPPHPQLQQMVKSQISSSSPSSPQPSLYNQPRPHSLRYDAYQQQQQNQHQYTSRKNGVGIGLGVRPRSQNDASTSSYNHHTQYASPLLEPLSTGRLPKARVFVHRERRKPSLGSSSAGSPIRAASDKRCVSDLALVAERSNCSPPPFSHGRLYTDLTDAAAYLSADVDVIPPWIPDDELRDWAPASTATSSRLVGISRKASPGAAAASAALSYAGTRRKGRRQQLDKKFAESGSSTDFDDDDDDDYVDDDADMEDADGKITAMTTLMSSTSGKRPDVVGGISSSGGRDGMDGSSPAALVNDGRWVASLRNLAAIARPKGKEPPCIRGSILDVAPPSLSERFGLSALGAGKKLRSVHSDARPVSNARRGRARTDLRDANDGACRSTMVKSTTGPDLLSVSVDAEVPSKPSRCGLEREALPTGHVPVMHGRDEYVGFLLDSAKPPARRRQRRWLRLFRWSRSPQLP